MRFLAAAAAVLFALVVAAPAGAAVGSDLGAFHADCEFSTRLNDDPIVFPNMPGASHSHDFSGSLTINAFSTPASIRQGPTSCVRSDTPASDVDRSAYWVPTLYVDNKIVQETTLGAYYKSGVRDTSAIEPFPAGLVIIAGSGTGGPQVVDGEQVWAFLCPQGTLVNGSASSAPTCKGNLMELAIRFPDCWNGTSLDSPNHKSHMAYSRRVGGAAERTCPSTHPRLVPMLEIKMRYPTAGGPGVRLSSGPIDTAHADFMNGWDQARLASLVKNCLVADRYCGGGDVPDGRSPVGAPPSGHSPVGAPVADGHSHARARAHTHAGTTSRKARSFRRARSSRKTTTRSRACRASSRRTAAPQRSKCKRKRSARRKAAAPRVKRAH